MPKIKLKEWADRHNLSYITANRHFHAGLIPGAVQLDSGTILVEDDSMEQTMAANASTNDAMSLFLKKTVEFSKNNGTVEDFAAWVISTFQLKLNTQTDSPRYSKNKPRAEEVQKHFQQFIDKDRQVQLKQVKEIIEKTGGAAPKVEGPNPFDRVVETVTDEGDDFNLMAEILSAGAPQDSDVRLYGPQTIAEGLVTRSVDLNTTPQQQINYTGSTSSTFSNTTSSPPVTSTASFTADAYATPLSAMFSSGPADGGWDTGSTFYVNTAMPAAASSPFQPTQKELLSAVKVIETAETDDLPRKRGRKPTLKFNKR